MLGLCVRGGPVGPQGGPSLARTSSGPKVAVISTSPSASYLRPGPPVYTYAEAAPAAAESASCHAGALESSASGARQSAAIPYDTPTSRAACAGAIAPLTSVWSEEPAPS